MVEKGFFNYRFGSKSSKRLIGAIFLEVKDPQTAHGAGTALLGVGVLEGIGGKTPQ